MMLLDLFLVLFFLQFSGGQSWPLMSGLLHLEGPERAATPPRLLLAVPNVTAHHQRPLYQLHIIRLAIEGLVQQLTIIGKREKIL